MLDQLKIRGERPKSNSFGLIVGVIPSLTDLVIVFPILFMLLKMQGVSTLLGDGDTGWHIRTGEWILQHRQVPRADIFSFSKPGQPWFAWEWAWDVIFAWVHQLGCLPAVVFFNILLLGVICVLLFQLVKRESASHLIAAFVTLLALAGTSLHWLARPHLASWLFILIFCHVLNRAAEGQTQLLIWLPALMLLWTNLHGGFFVGIALVFIYAADPLVNALLGRGQMSRAKPFLLAGAACLVVSFINPYSHGLHQHVIAYLLDSRQVENILEFQSINFHHPLARYFEIFLVVGVLAAFHGMKRGRFTEALLILTWAHLALVSIRNIPVFLLFAAPAVARTAAGWLQRFKALATAEAEFGALERLPRFHFCSAAVFALLVVFMVRPVLMKSPGAVKLLTSEYDPGKYPAEAIERLRTLNASSVFTDDEWGDYLIYRMYPATRVFVDGRSDFYGADFESRYLELMNVRFDWEQCLSKFGVNTMLLRVDAPLAGALKQSPRWKVAYDDGVALIFLRQSAVVAPLFAENTFSPGAPDRGIGR